nr:MAG TPA: hypothetical protein [Caudoviricetes sp.]
MESLHNFSLTLQNCSFEIGLIAYFYWDSSVLKKSSI